MTMIPPMTTETEPADLFDALPRLVREWADAVYATLGASLPVDTYAEAFAVHLNELVAENYPALAKSRIGLTPITYRGHIVCEVEPEWMWLVAGPEGEYLIQVIEYSTGDEYLEHGVRLTNAERDTLALSDLRLVADMNGQCGGIAVNFAPSANGLRPFLSLDRQPELVPLSHQE